MLLAVSLTARILNMNTACKLQLNKQGKHRSLSVWHFYCKLFMTSHYKVASTLRPCPVKPIHLGADHLIRGGAMVFPLGSNFFFRLPA